MADVGATQHSVLPMKGFRISINTVMLALLFMAIFAGFQGGRYYMANRLQELGIACALSLFVTGAWFAAFDLPYKEWYRWVITPIVLIGAIMGVSSLVFVINYGGSLFYSFFSAREFLLAFMGPGVYLLVRTGLSEVLVKRVFWFAMFALMVNYLFFYFTMDLRAAFFSSDHTVSNLVTYDEWRGFRLKPPLFAIMLAILGALCLLVQAPTAKVRLFAIAMLVIGGYIWSIVQFRSTLATMVLSLMLYPVLLSRKSQLQIVLVLAPLVLLVMPAFTLFALDAFLNADGGSIRAKAFAKAIEHFMFHPILGAGEDSAYGLSYQDIVAPYFFPSDLGIVGMAYKYGLIGTLLYLGMHAKIWIRLWRANLMLKQAGESVDPLVWGILLFMTAQTFNLALNPGLAYAQGITMGTMGMALGSLAIQRVGNKER